MQCLKLSDLVNHLPFFHKIQYILMHQKVHQHFWIASNPTPPSNCCHDFFFFSCVARELLQMVCLQVFVSKQKEIQFRANTETVCQRQGYLYGVQLNKLKDLHMFVISLSTHHFTQFVRQLIDKAQGAKLFQQ